MLSDLLGPIQFVRGRRSARYPYSNSVYVAGAGVLIDAGADPGCYEALCRDQGIRQLWLSHWHEDHIAFIDHLGGVPMRQSPLEAEPLTGLQHCLDWYGIRDSDFRAYWGKAFTETFHFRPRRAAAYFTPGEVVDLGVCTVEIIHTPGHTPGSTSFFFREPGVVFTGDYDLTRFGPWYGDRDSSIEDTIASVERLRRLPARVWLTGHEEGCFVEPEGAVFDNYLKVIDEREGKLLDFLRGGPRSMVEIVGQRIVYRKPREPRAFFDWGEEAILGKHLQRLMRQGTVRLEDGRYQIVS